MKKIILFFSLCLSFLSAFSKASELPPKTTPIDIASCNLESKESMEVQNPESIQEIYLIKKTDLFQEKFQTYQILPKSNDVSKYWQHSKIGGNQHLNMLKISKLRLE